MNTLAPQQASAASRVQSIAMSRRGWLKTGVLFVFLGAAALLMEGVAPDAWWVHGAWCIAGLAVTVPMLFRAFRRGVAIVLRDHLVMLTGSFSLYFLFGALLPVFGPEWQVSDNLRYYPFGADTALRIDAINAFGFGVALMVSAVSSQRWFFRQADRVALSAMRVPPALVMLLLMLGGAVASWYVLSVELGLRDGVVSGIWRTAAKFSLIAVYLGTSYRGRHARKLGALAVLIAGVEVLGGMLLFNKTQVLFPLGALIAGFSVRYRTKKLLLPGIVVLGLLFMTLGGIASYGRNALDSESHQILRERWQVLGEAVEASEAEVESTRYNAWGRICYLPTQAAAIDFYNSGIGGRDLQLVPWILVPRMLFPSKPIMTRSGTELHAKISGRQGSSSAPGIFVDGYYNWGWLGVLFVSVIGGWILAQTSAIATAILSRDALLLLPFSLMGLYIAFRIDGNFVSGYLGSFVYLVYGLLGTSFVLAAARTRHNGSQGGR